jgi:hypothetical protein
MSPQQASGSMTVPIFLIQVQMHDSRKEGLIWKAEHRAASIRRSLRHPTDLTDAEWAPLAPIIPPANHGGRHRAGLQSGGQAGALLQHGRFGEPARSRDARRAPGADRRSVGQARLRGPGRTWVSAVRAVGRPASVPLDRPALRAPVGGGDNEPGVRGMAECVLRRKNDDRTS